MKGAFNYIQPKNIQNQNIITIPIPVYSNFIPQNYNLSILNTLKSLPTNPNFIINIPAINYYNNLLQNYQFYLNANNLNKHRFNQLQIPEISCSNNLKKKKDSIDKESTSSNSSEKEGNENNILGKKKKRITKICTECPHKFAVHYAKGMCSNCYHSRGRSKKPWNCPHVNKTHYALGLCQNCYQMNYIKKQYFNLNEGNNKNNSVMNSEDNKGSFDEEKIINELLLKEKENKNELEIEKKIFTIKK